MSSVFLFGAGASYGSGDCYPEPPPLGNGNEGLFKKLQERGGFASSITNPLANLFIKDFENGMAELYEKSEREAYSLLREMCLYFTKFKPKEKNLYKELIKFIISTKHPVVFATTNYDLLIEDSIYQLGYGALYKLLPVFTNTFLVLKIHGSCNFLPYIPGITIRGATYKSVETVLDVPVKIARVPEVIKFCNEEDSIAPAIAMYAKGKAVKFCPKFVLQQQKLWQESVFNVKRIFVIGLRVNPEDTHIWQALASSKAELFYVGEKEDFNVWTKENRSENARWIADKFVESIPIIKGYLS